MTLPAEEEQRRLKLYERGYSDKLIAEKVGVDPNTVSYWRGSRGLPWRPPFHLSDDEEKRRMELYQQGYMDTEIADELEVEQSAVSEWRKSRGLPRHGGSGGRGRMEADKEQRRLRLYEQGYTDSIIAEKEDVCYSGIRGWRERRNLPPRHHVKRCTKCGRGFESVNPDAKYCRRCRKDKEQKYYLINQMRYHFAEVAEVNPEMAKEIMEEMREEEGDGFTEMALDGVYENVIERKREKEEI